MDISNSNPHHGTRWNLPFLRIADDLKPILKKKCVCPFAFSSTPLKKGDRLLLDFGRHCVGFISFAIRPHGSPPDAPAYLRLKFGERMEEIMEDSGNYAGLLGSGWIQEEFIHIDKVPSQIRLPRRYAFRYMEILVIDTSPKYSIVPENVRCMTVTSADRRKHPRYLPISENLRQIADVAVTTLQECMQDVFEDGPKRDRRLWVGDLRLQALVNYQTFKNNALVKRCLYLFAAMTGLDGRIAACIFTEPEPQADDTVLFDYSLLFITCLVEYYLASGDILALKELWDTAFLQIELSKEALDTHGIIIDRETWWCFVDWKDGLNKQASAQAILICALKQALFIAEVLSDEPRRKSIEHMIEYTTKGALAYLWDEETGFFVSGEQKQISWMSQIWFVLADIIPKEKQRWLLEHLVEMNPSMGMITPYAVHYYLEALFHADMPEEARRYMEYYWGGMLAARADCFWEFFVPTSSDASPYGASMIHSFCHAWSCTPAYFIYRYFSTMQTNKRDTVS
jgi:hypothetical protein